MKHIIVFTSLVLIISVFSLSSCNSSKVKKENQKVETQATDSLNKAISLAYRGVVYDVGLQFNPGTYSVEPYNPDLVKYDMKVIKNELHANTVRIEGEEISRIVDATLAAHNVGLKVFFNPWKMGADAPTTIAYMSEAAKAAEKLREQGIDLVFVAGCEYSLFSKGALPGETFNDRMVNLAKNLQAAAIEQKQTPEMMSADQKLNDILSEIMKGVRENFKGKVTYSSGSWENINWDLFDIVGVDYYRNGESKEQYVKGLERYKKSKPLFVMEVGSCTYEGAGAKGAGGFSIFQGVNPDGTVIYEGGNIPIRSEKEQADGVFIYVFAFPQMPYSEEKGKDMDMTSYALVKTFSKQDSRSQKIPNWEKKEAFTRLSNIYEELSHRNK
jgi:hypothetical protein